MQLNLGKKIREPRHRDGRTQEALAEVLGVTSQAVSRWESDGSYPDMEIIPSIANYFGVSIDELFGYNCDREKKIDELIARVNELDLQNGGTDACLDECLSLLREGMAEFPGNEKITLRLASLLSETGWIRHGERILRDNEGYSVHDVEYHKRNEYWNEAIKLLETLLSSNVANEVFQQASYELILLYRNIGEYEKAIAIAEAFPDIRNCRQNMLTYACDGQKQAEFLGEAILAMINTCVDQLIQALMATESNFKSDLPVKTIDSAIKLFDIVCTDGNYGIYNSKIACLYLYLSEHQWRAGAHDKAFESLDKALEHAKAFEAFNGQCDITYTAPLIKYVKVNPENQQVEKMAYDLPRVWPWWCVPDYGSIKSEMQADSRWNEWVEKTKRN